MEKEDLQNIRMMLGMVSVKVNNLQKVVEYIEQGQGDQPDEEEVECLKEDYKKLKANLNHLEELFLVDQYKDAELKKNFEEIKEKYKLDFSKVKEEK